MKLKLLLIDNDINDTIKSVHIVSNKNATYICQLHCKASDNIYNELFNLVSSHSFHFRANEKGFDTGDYEGFDYTLLKGTYKKYDYVYNQLEELTNQLKNIKGLTKTDGERYLESFKQEVKDYFELEHIHFYMKYCLSGGQEDDIKEQHSNYLLGEQVGDTNIEDILSYEEWLEQVYYIENQDSIDQYIEEYKDPLDVTVYHNKQGDEIQYSIYEIQLTWGGPNIMVTIGTRLKEVTYEFIWGGERIKEDLSYLYDQIELYFNLEYYE